MIEIKGAVLHEPGDGLRIEQLTLEEPHANEVLVRVEAAGVCHSDYHYMAGDLRCPLPVVLGHEGAGTVEAVGPGVTRVKPGDRVVLMWRARCGQCRYCASGRPALCEAGRIQPATGGLMDGTTRLRLGGETVHHFLGVSCFAERCVVSEASIVPIPPSVPPAIAAIVGCAVITGLGAVLNVVGRAAARSVLVLGAGGVGLSAVMGAKLAGAYPIIVADIARSKLDLAADLGATHCLDVSERDLAEQVLELAPDGVDWALEAIGRPQTMEQALECLRPGGTAVAIGLTDGSAAFSVSMNALVQKERTIRGSLYGSANSTIDIPELLSLYESEQLPLDRLLGGSFALEDVNRAFDALTDGAVGRGVILPARVAAEEALAWS